MRRAIAIAFVALALPLTPAVAAPFPPRGGEVEFATFTVRASNGLSASVEATANQITLAVGKGPQLNVYTVRGELSDRGIKGRFGKLGRVSVRFEPARTARLRRLAGGCDGPSQRTVEAVFTGTIRFRGENGYATVDASRAVGEVEYSHPPNCARRRDVIPDPWAYFEKLEREFEFDQVAVLQATDRRRLLAAIAVDTEERQAAFFYGGTRERRGRMEILRLAGVKAPLSAFAFDHTTGTATLTPPAPFTGSATFQRGPDGSKAWSGSLSVPLLGSEPVLLAGPRFRAGLAPDFNED